MQLVVVIRTSARAAQHAGPAVGALGAPAWGGYLVGWRSSAHDTKSAENKQPTVPYRKATRSRADLLLQLPPVSLRVPPRLVSRPSERSKDILLFFVTVLQTYERTLELLPVLPFNLTYEDLNM